jgi:hypothetical protein
MIISIRFQLLITMQNSWSSLLLWEAAAIRIGLAQLRFPYHTTNVGGEPTLINLYLDPSKYKPVQRYSRAQYPPLCVVRPWRIHRNVYTILSPSSHSQCAVVVSPNGIVNVLGLPEYVASTTSHYHKRALQRTVLNRYRQGHYIKPQTWRKPRFRPVSY